MKRRVLAYLLATVVVAPMLAGPRTLVRLDGWIVDSYCGAKNAHAEAAEDTLACHKKGAKLILITADGTSYALDDQERALQHVGKQVKLFGLVDADRNLNVGNYIGADPLDTSQGKEKKDNGNLMPRKSAPAKPAAPSEPPEKED